MTWLAIFANLAAEPTIEMTRALIFMTSIRFQVAKGGAQCSI